MREINYPFRFGYLDSGMRSVLEALKRGNHEFATKIAQRCVNQMDELDAADGRKPLGEISRAES